MMRTDNYFEIGSSHEVCQDYALSGQINDNISYAIVSDGCTMSHKACSQVDLGARILAHSAKDCIKRIWQQSEKVENVGTTIFNDIEEVNVYLRERVIILTRMIEKQLELPDLFADCTLLIAVADKEGKAITFMYGDGSVYVKKTTGTEHVIDVTFTSGAPLYLSYHTDPARKRAYMEQFGEMPVFIEEFDVSDIESAKDKEIGSYSRSLIYAKDPKIYERSIRVWEDVELISLTSDGAKSFLKHVDNEFEPVDFLDVMAEFHAYKNKNGVFVQRRMKSMNKAHKKADISHYDDISVSAIITG
jgi:hypothetical protein